MMMMLTPPLHTPGEPRRPLVADTGSAPHAALSLMSCSLGSSTDRCTMSRCTRASCRSPTLKVLRRGAEGRVSRRYELCIGRVLLPRGGSGCQEDPGPAGTNGLLMVCSAPGVLRSRCAPLQVCSGLQVYSGLQVCSAPGVLRSRMTGEFIKRVETLKVERHRGGDIILNASSCRRARLSLRELRPNLQTAASISEAGGVRRGRSTQGRQLFN
ncbi:hypothetical protein EYF80_049103 [Liparis tanakae]|uniref:Uncharacterized protein n=1 Tax=Liparis tanakae TaxID=230148 RepID=A0A4Z2FIV7_9TELE|nr:hypothetical protein EYF80_049103 [Liparis tanakae]